MKKYKITIILIAAVVILSAVSLFVGAYSVTLEGLINNEVNQAMLMIVSRVPRLLAILCTGIGMSVAGLIMQNLCANKFISPTTCATITSAQLGVLFTLFIIPTASLVTRTTITFFTAILGTWVFVWFVQKIKFKDVVMVPLIGMMFSSVMSGIITYFSYSNDLTQEMQTTLMGDFSVIIKGRYEIVFMVLPLVVLAFIFANHFNVVGMGENFSKNLGVNYQFVLFAGLGIVAVITASIVVTVGSIAYIGLIIPNIVAIFKGDKIRGSLLDVGLFGAVYVLICDIIGRIVIHPFELPINLTSGIIGSVLFLALMFYRLSGKKPKPSKNSANSEVTNHA